MSRRINLCYHVNASLQLISRMPYRQFTETHRSGIGYDVFDIIWRVHRSWVVCALIRKLLEPRNDKGEALAIHDVPMECINLYERVSGEDPQTVDATHTFTQLIASSVRLMSDNGKLVTASTTRVINHQVSTYKFRAVSNMNPR